ncbi:MAG: hypothetical protein Hyperionvirus4_73 [Hyperionvirus sp.]|uniref:RING-type domain-containing protein n=1 Tax=Hyperionvirus sp. TaxID=2487770 RepID=A0A3G5A7G4_9VIRU|nr:MAG: hypothetical protein Hyperionvirus4_73 [Hyperionvirus sp.]
MYCHRKESVSLVAPVGESEIFKLKKYLRDNNLLEMDLTKSIKINNLEKYRDSIEHKNDVVLFFFRTEQTAPIFHYFNLAYGMIQDATIILFRQKRVCAIFMTEFDNTIKINLELILKHKELQCTICYGDDIKGLTGCFQCSFRMCLSCREKHGAVCPQCKCARIFVPNSEISS